MCACVCGCVRVYMRVYGFTSVRMYTIMHIQYCYYACMYIFTCHAENFQTHSTKPYIYSIASVSYTTTYNSTTCMLGTSMHLSKYTNYYSHVEMLQVLTGSSSLVLTEVPRPSPATPTSRTSSLLWLALFCSRFASSRQFFLCWLLQTSQSTSSSSL